MAGGFARFGKEEEGLQLFPRLKCASGWQLGLRSQIARRFSNRDEWAHKNRIKVSFTKLLYRVINAPSLPLGGPDAPPGHNRQLESEFTDVNVRVTQKEGLKPYESDLS